MFSYLPSLYLIVGHIHTSLALTDNGGFSRIRRVHPDGPILGVPENEEQLPVAILPGHVLNSPSRGRLKSANKYPIRDDRDTRVYGNLDNVGITSGNIYQRVLYSNYRKANSLWAGVLRALSGIMNERSSKSEAKAPLVVFIKSHLEAKPSRLQILESQNNAAEVLDHVHSSYELSNNGVYSRRSRKRTKKHNTESDDASDSSPASLETEKNPGNPFTIHGKKYKQNWPWNFQTDGDHMNISPFAPPVNEAIGPSAAQLFFGRKWWYFNQDDYVPFR